MRLVCKSLEWYSQYDCNQTLPKFHSTSPSVCACCSNQAHAWIQSLIESHSTELNVKLANQVFAKSKLDNDDFLISVCDLSVYTRNRNFRLAGSSKLTGSGCLWPENVCNDFNNRPVRDLAQVWPHCSDWANTLVTYSLTK